MGMRMIDMIAGLAGLLSLYGCVGDRDRCDLLKTWVVGDELHIVGTLNRHAHREIAEQIEAHPEVRVLVLDNIDGTLNAVATLETASFVHARGLDTHLPAHGFIESGGVDLFCGGNKRTAVPGGHVGVHSWWSSDGTTGATLPKTDEAHAEQFAFFDKIGCPSSFYNYTLNAAPGNGMYVMKRQELLKEGVVTKFVKRLEK